MKNVLFPYTYTLYIHYNNIRKLTFINKCNYANENRVRQFLGGGCLYFQGVYPPVFLPNSI